jgi:UDP-N-acetylmuramoylalanine--D-glutamate ligase
MRKTAAPAGLELAGLAVLVVGAARTGVAAANFLLRRGARVTITDAGNAAGLQSHLDRLGGEAALELGGHRRETFLAADLIVPSPGVPMDDPLLVEVAGKGIPVMSEIELAARFLPLPLIAVTGTNGKSTTVTALGEVLEEAGIPCRVGGNIGNPLVGEVDTLEGLEYLVAEISSFQLEWIETFRPRIAAILNITEDHLDRYRSFEEYVTAKARIFENQGPEDYLILNADDPLVRETAAPARSRKVWFSRRMTPRFGVHLFRGWIYSRLGRGAGRRIMPVEEMKIVGKHNWENALAVTAAALLAGANAAAVRRALGRFRGLPHRTEFVREREGVKYYDDSKATNVGAAARTVAGFGQPVVLIAGGRDKGGSYGPLAPLMKGHVRRLIVMGEAAGKMAEELQGATEIVRASGMEEAVVEAARAARKGDAVVLAPACSSFDSYSDYARRGRHFQEEVGKL